LTKEIENLYFEIVVTNLITFFITALHEAAFFYKQWKLHFSKSVKLEKDNIEAKYETLKAQVNPHFLFNSLNSLTSIVEDNQHAVNYIQNLSEFLRYVLKSRDKELVPLSDELEILNKYVSLQKSRFNKNLNVIIDINKDLGHFALPPLVLQMLVENCIKHNIISGEKPLFITIEAYSGWIHVENNLQKKNPAESTGNGLRNIVERYRFFTKNDVKILETDSTFKVSVPLLHFKI
jgi:LytS/YehU family sensor histidine kinase